MELFHLDFYFTDYAKGNSIIVARHSGLLKRIYFSAK